MSLRVVGAIAAFWIGTTAGVRAEIRLGPGAIAASVRDRDGRPVAGALVVADGPTSREATTGVAGVVTLQALPLGTYTVSVTRAGFTPAGWQVTLAAGGKTPALLSLRIVPASFADLRDVVSPPAAPALGAVSRDPFVAHALTDAPGVQILPASPGAGVVGQAGAGESRVELDGIPLAGAPATLGALRFHNAYSLNDVELEPGPGLLTSTVRNAIGGIVDLRTPSIERAPAGVAQAGYDSAFGSFQHVLFTQTAGKVGLLGDLVTGGGENRSQTLKASYALSSATSLAIASYDAQTAFAADGGSVTNVSPAFAADLRASVGAGTLQARTFASASRTTASGNLATGAEDARTQGTQLRYDLPAGENMLSLGFDRRTERTTFAETPEMRQTFTAVTVLANLHLTRLMRLEAGDAYTGGTLLPARNDPQLALAWRASDRFTLRLAAGGAFNTPPDAVLALRTTVPHSLAPETSFGYRISADATPNAWDHAWGSAFDLRLYDRFATPADARVRGVELGFERMPAAGRRFGALAWLDLVDSRQFGPPQPLTRTLANVAAASRDFSGEPYSKARVALTYRAGAAELRFGSTWLGANNVLAARGIALGDVSCAFPVSRFADVRVGAQNLFGARTLDRALAPLYAPHEFTLVVGRTVGQ